MTTLQSLLTLLRQRTSMETSQFCTDDELTTYINNSLALLDGILISKFSDYKMNQATLSTTTDELQLPLDFLKFRGLDILTADGSANITLEPFEFKNRNKEVFVFNQIKYRLQGNKIKLIPVQLASQYQYLLYYTPDYIPLVNLTDTLQAYMDSQAWSEYAIVDSAVKVCAKQNLDPSTFMAQAQELKDHITKLSAPNRNQGDPVSIVDSRTYATDWRW